MTNWVLRGLRTGIKTTRYPGTEDATAGVTPGRPVSAPLADEEASAIVEACPTGAIARNGAAVAIDLGKCVHCFRCAASQTEAGLPWKQDYEWAAFPSETATARRALERAFGRSLHIRFVDAGACGACMSEARQLNNPYYNMHRLGFFITPTPRNADALLVAGPVSDAMRLPLRKVYDAMPTPKRVIAIGACAISGGVFGPSFSSAGGVGEVIPIDVTVPGCPPPPLAILHGLLVLVGRKPPMARVSQPSASAWSGQ
jgi:Ni,Fe-hydrogenase III small subunit/NAD-dependent dihydropyrimidine dehydrogenase PreA subunit